MIRIVFVALGTSLILACGPAESPEPGPESAAAESAEGADLQGETSGSEDLPADDSVIAVEGFESGESEALESGSEDDDTEPSPSDDDRDEETPDRDGAG